MGMVNKEDTGRGSRMRLWFLLAATAQVAAPLVFQLSGAPDLGSESPEVPQPEVVPAAYAFAIWGLITLLTLAYAGWQARSRSAHVGRLAGPYALVCVGFILWLVAAAFPVSSAVATPVIFIGMYILLLVTALRFRENPAPWPRPARVLLEVAIGLYAGWTGVAVWVNIATGLTSISPAVAGTIGTATGTVWQLLLVLAATAATVITAIRFRSSPVLQTSLSAAATWALIAASIGAAATGANFLMVAAAACAAATAAVSLVLTAGTLGRT